MLRRRRRYALTSAGIVAFWLVMMGLLFRREFLAPHLSSAAGRRLSGPTETWMGVFTPGGDQLGYVNLRTRPEVRENVPGAKMSVTAQLRMPMLDRPTDILITGSGWSPAAKGRTQFDFRVQSGEHRLRIEGTAGNGLLDAVLHTAGESIPLQVPIQEDVTFWSAVGPSIDATQLQLGKAYLTKAFDPVTMSMGQARITYVGDEELDVAGEVVSTKMVSIAMSGFTSKAWIAADNEIVRAETPFGLTLMKIAPERASLVATAGAGGDLIAMSAIRPAGQAVQRGALRMVVRLDGFPVATAVPTDDTQHQVGPHTFAIVTPSAPTPTDAVAYEDPSLLPYLSGDAFIQTGHPEIVKTSEAIVGGETEPWARALRVYAWVYDTIEKTAVFSVPSALDVLATKEGDCNEHTILFAALARAAGIPTRIALGVVWSEQYEAFYYHAWPEVYVGRWIWMDPTLGQPIADATHIKLVTGGIEKWFGLISYLGKLGITVQEITFGQ